MCSIPVDNTLLIAVTTLSKKYDPVPPTDAIWKDSHSLQASRECKFPNSLHGMPLQFASYACHSCVLACIIRHIKLTSPPCRRAASLSLPNIRYKYGHRDKPLCGELGRPGRRRPPLRAVSTTGARLQRAIAAGPCLGDPSGICLCAVPQQCRRRVRAQSGRRHSPLWTSPPC